jgi:hypothetical protein
MGIMKTKNRISRIDFCEWDSESFGTRNIGGLICESCNFHRTLRRREEMGDYHHNNKLDRDHKCPNCKKSNWYWLPPIARVPRKKSSKSVWNKFWKLLKSREFNHPKHGCR